MKDLSQLQKLNDFVDDAAFIRDVSKVKQVERKEPFCCSGVVVFCFVLLHLRAKPSDLTLPKKTFVDLQVTAARMLSLCVATFTFLHFRPDFATTCFVLGFFQIISDVFSHRTTK